MSGYTSASRHPPPAYDETVAAVRQALADQGFGVLTEIDLRATLKSKLDVDVPAQVILGACRPELAHTRRCRRPVAAVLLPCNVVVRDDARHHSRRGVRPLGDVELVDDHPSCPRWPPTPAPD